MEGWGGLDDPRIERDPDYELVPLEKKSTGGPKGRQCGKCGMKFNFGIKYGYHCTQTNCPMVGWR